MVDLPVGPADIYCTHLTAIFALIPYPRDEGSWDALRYWATMPDDVHVLLADLPEGEHVLTLQGVSPSGSPLRDMTWEVPVFVRRGRVNLVWTRALPSGAPAGVAEY